MILSLPAETVFEARRRARRSALAMFVILLVIYAVAFNLMVFAALFAVVFFSGSVALIVAAGESFWGLNLAALAVGAAVAIFHFVRARLRPLDHTLALLGAFEVDPKDDYHRRFAGAVGEAEVATGVRPIKPMILRSTGTNACSVRAPDGAAICATEGLLARMTRTELTAVVAHEAARIAAEDSRLTTTACSLVNVFDRVETWMQQGLSEGARPVSLSTGHAGGGGLIAGVFVWIVAAIARGILSLIFMGVSRRRGYLADAHAVQMSKDPLALAEALSKMARGHRGVGELKPGYEALFIMDPRPRSFAESDGFLASVFSTHPPTSRRIRRLVAWAQTDASALVAARATSEGPKRIPPREDGARFFTHHDGEWKGPYLTMQMLALGILRPDSWVYLAAAGEVCRGQDAATEPGVLMRASDSPFLLPAFKLKSLRSVSGRGCPRCKVSLVERSYEGAPTFRCTFCKGHLLKQGVLERVIARRDRGFTEAEIALAHPPSRLRAGRTGRWRRARTGPACKACGFPEIACPLCGKRMYKRYHSILVKVVVDVCSDRACGAVWCDDGELERIQILIEEHSAG